jgi:hypothetical protein
MIEMIGDGKRSLFMKYKTSNIKVNMKIILVFTISLGINLSIFTYAFSISDKFSGDGTPRAPASTASLFLGNKETKVYYTPNCSGYKDVRPENRISFKSAKEAEDAGYKRAQDCR